VLVTFPLSGAGKLRPRTMRALLVSQGIRRVYDGGRIVPVEQMGDIAWDAETRGLYDRLTVSRSGRARIVDSIEGCLRLGRGRLDVVLEDGRIERFSSSASPATSTAPRATSPTGRPSRTCSPSTAPSAPARRARASGAPLRSTRTSSCPISHCPSAMGPFDPGEAVCTTPATTTCGASASPAMSRWMSPSAG